MALNGVTLNGGREEMKTANRRSNAMGGSLFFYAVCLLGFTKRAICTLIS